MKAIVHVWLLIGVGWLLSCQQPADLPAPVVAKLSKADSTKLAQETYNGDRPIYLDGEVMPTYYNPIINAPNDTVYLNKTRWSHWPIVRRNTFLPPNGTLYVSFHAGQSPSRIYESCLINVHPRTGLHRGSDLIIVGFSVGTGDGAYFSYDPDPKQDNWVRVDTLDAKKGLMNGEFSIHLVLEPNQERKFYDLLYPRSFHFHGKLHEL